MLHALAGAQQGMIYSIPPKLVFSDSGLSAPNGHFPAAKLPPFAG